MEPGKFDVVKLISRGSYSIVYEIVYTQEGDKTTPTTWALKRFYLLNSTAVRCALREHATLVRLAQAHKHSSFLPTLLQSFRICGAPAFVLQKGSGFDLRDLVANFGYLSEEDARFYSSEIVCGLHHLHAMRIVHLDVKPANVLIADSGHLLISDFDRSYDMTREAAGPPRKCDFTGSPFYMAPEIRHRVEITTRADVWSLGVLLATIMYGHARVEDWLRTLRFMTGRLPNVSTPLRQFFKACLTRNHRRRLDIGGVKCLDFFKDVDWEEVAACNTQPPYYPSEFEVSAIVEDFNLDPHDPLLLAAAYSTHMPLLEECPPDTRDRSDKSEKNGVRQLVVEMPNYVELEEAGLTAQRIDELLNHFHFTNSHLFQASHSFDEETSLNGHYIPRNASLHLPHPCSQSNSQSLAPPTFPPVTFAAILPSIVTICTPWLSLTQGNTGCLCQQPAASVHLIAIPLHHLGIAAERPATVCAQLTQFHSPAALTLVTPPLCEVSFTSEYAWRSMLRDSATQSCM
ncbi:Ribosomal protein S6 kinase alpha-1 [Taenia crassiceps]|uniref:Ribosomal protein S6 kinase alpha-1 n=1 Tax=Taenia crassiceps TaxID=6207 RepID=A0ABR4Q2X6_9CEST